MQPDKVFVEIDVSEMDLLTAEKFIRDGFMTPLDIEQNIAMKVKLTFKDNGK